MSRDYYYSEAEREEETHIALNNQRHWELDLVKFQEAGARDRATAIRWDMDAFDARNGNVLDVGYYCYLRGIDYTLEAGIKELLG